MLNALLKGLPLAPMEKLNLTVTWDREDLAREILEEMGGVGLDWPDASLDEAMMNALMYDRVDFVHLLLSNGLAMDRFLTIPRLEQLYNSVSTCTQQFSSPNPELFGSFQDSGPPNTLRFILRDVVKNVSANYKYKLSHIGLIIEKLMGFGYRSTYCRREFLRRYKIELQNPVSSPLGHYGLVDGLQYIRVCFQRRRSTVVRINGQYRQRASSSAAFVDDNFSDLSRRKASMFVRK